METIRFQAKLKIKAKNRKRMHMRYVNYFALIFKS